MAYELIKEKIVLDRKIGKESTQVLLEGDIIVPDIKPDISVILQSDSKVFITKVEISTDRINFMGRVDISILYLAKGFEKPVHSMNISAQIDDFINLDGISKDMWADVRANIANIEYRLLNDRKISYRAVIEVTVVAECSDTHEIVINISDIPENQCKKTSLDVNKSIENKEDRFIVKDEISVPSGKPNLREILQCNVAVSNKDIRVSNGKVSVHGELIVTTLYKGDTDDNMIEFMEHEIPFNGAVDVSNARDEMFADVVLSISDQYIQIRPDSDGEDRVVEIEVSVDAQIKVNSLECIEILEDAYCINQKLNISKQQIKYPKLISRNKNQTPIKEIIQLDENCPDILQIFVVKGNPHLDDIKVLDDKVIVEGVIETNVLYVAESDNTPLYSHKSIIPYKQTIETKGTTINMDVSVNVNIDHVGFNMLSGREFEVRFLMSFNTQVNQEIEGNMITNIDFSEMDKETLSQMPSITVYYVEKGDTLWKIAKRYNTTIAEIASINNIENVDKIYPGENLLIIKKVGA